MLSKHTQNTHQMVPIEKFLGGTFLRAPSIYFICLFKKSEYFGRTIYQIHFKLQH